MKIFIKLYTMVDHRPNGVDNFKRFVAFAVDWVLGYLCFVLPVAIIWLYHTKDAGNLVTNVATVGLKLGWGSAGLAFLLSLIIAIIYFVVYPLKHNGQTPGKKFMGLKIVKTDDSAVDLKTLIMRQILGVFLIEGYFCMISEMARQLFILAGFQTAFLVLSVIAVMVSGISAFLCVKFESHRMIHDYIAGTKVILEQEIN